MQDSSCSDPPKRKFRVLKLFSRKGTKWFISILHVQCTSAINKVRIELSFQFQINFNCKYISIYTESCFLKIYNYTTFLGEINYECNFSGSYLTASLILGSQILRSSMFSLCTATALQKYIVVLPVNNKKL